jgi:hypothetical protein
MTQISINPNFPQVIPAELLGAKEYLNWKYLLNKKQKLLKVPVDVNGVAKSFDNPSILKPLPNALKTAQSNGWGIGIGLNDGLYISDNGLSGYLWCADFDGWAELNGSNVDSGVVEILDGFNSYTEMSPSGTGFKVFILSDKKPTTKMKVRFSESDFAKDFPDIDKYRNRAIEIFSQKLFLAMTGELFSSARYNKIRFIKSDELEQLIDNLDKVAKFDGGLGLNLTAPVTVSVAPIPKSAKRLTIESLDLVLSFIDADDEQTWSDVVNALARLYGEDGRHSFHEYSKKSDKYDEVESDERYNRALKELSNHPEGYGTKRLLDLARSNSRWDNPELHNELDIPLQEIIAKEIQKNWRQGITASELSGKTFEPLMWVVQDILPEGCYLLSARPKVGKSWLSLQISLAVALGESTLGKKVVKGKAIYLALEDNQRRLQDRLQQLRPNGYKTDDLLLYTQWAQFDQGGIEELVELIKREEPKLVVIDTLAKVRAASRNNHVYENDYKTLAPLTALASTYRMCILIVTHNRKGKSENDALEQVSGSLGLTGAVDGALVIDGVRTDKQYKMSLIGRDIPNDDELAIERKLNGEWQILGNASQVFVSEERKAVLELLHFKPEGLKPKEIAELLDKKPSAVRKLLTTMVSNGQLISNNGNYKHTTPIGNSSNCSSSGNLGIGGNSICLDW